MQALFYHYFILISQYVIKIIYQLILAGNDRTNLASIKGSYLVF